jgi:hypothetical protein
MWDAHFGNAAPVFQPEKLPMTKWRQYNPGMPEVLRVGGYRFFFFSREGDEPRHIHVRHADKYAKFWLEPIELAESRGFLSSELRHLHKLIEEHRQSFILCWDEHFGQ